MSDPKHIMDLIPAAQSSALQKQESKEPKTGDEKSFAVALKSKKIIHCQLEEVKEVLRYVMVKVGLRAQNFPNDLEKLILFEHIAKYYGGHHVEEIKVAFDLAITGQLDFPDGESANCYENFTCRYFSSVMNAYQKWAAQVHRTVIEPKMEVPEQKINTDEELDNFLRQAVQTQYFAYLKGMQLFNPEINASILTKDNLLLPEEKVVDFYKRMAEKKVIEIYKPVE